MFNRFIISLTIAAATLFAAACSSSSVCGPDVPYSAAHRGAHIGELVPENTPAAVAMAARYGYRAIECDVQYTVDSFMVVMHDRTINRTMRNKADYSPVEEKLYVRDLKFEDLRNNYVIASSDESLRTPIPTLEEHLQACMEYGIVPIMHTFIVEAFEYAHSVMGDNFVAFDESYEAMKGARAISNCLILWDPGKREAEETIAMLQEIGGKCGVSTMKDWMLDAEYIAKVRAAGYEAQSSIFPTPKELKAIDDGATIILSDFSLFNVRKDAKGEKKQIRKKLLSSGESVKLEWPGTVEFGSVEMCIEYSGELELIVNGERHYPLPAGENMRRIGGWRFHEQPASLEVVAVEDASVVLKGVEYKY